MSALNLPHFDVAVIGGPRMGKSSVLNCINENGIDEQTGELAFQTTDEVKEILCTHEFFTMNVIDTPEWPVPDPARSRELYDPIINGAVNRRLHALIWVVDFDTTTNVMLKDHKLFMTELAMVESAMILIFRGNEDFSKFNRQIRKKNEKIKEAIETMTADAQLLLKHVGLDHKISTENIIVCPDHEWMEHNMVEALFDRLKLHDPKLNDVRIFRDILYKYSSEEAMMEAKKRDSQRRLQHLRDYIADLTVKAGRAKALAIGTGVAATASGIAGFFTFGMTFGITVSAAALSATASATSIGINWQLENAKTEMEIEESKDAQTLDELKAEISKMTSDFNHFKEILPGF